MRTLPGLLLLALLGAAPVHAQDARKSTEATEASAEEEALTLERLFPEKRFFGASARSSSFSHDGRYAAYRWRTWPERRHGYDLWLHDFQTGETRRLTSATVFEPFQRDAKEVAEDRRERAKMAAAKKAKEKKADEDAKDAGKGPDDEDVDEDVERDLGDVVDEDDADREDAPRWQGVSSYVWSPVANEMLIVSGGDVYRWKVDGEGLERLTHTRGSEDGVQWLPDGSGFVHRQDDALLRVVFGDHRLVQLDPELPAGERLRSFSISPDGEKIALLASKGERGFTAGGRTVKIADYGERFMTVREVPRLVSDDPQPDRESILYVHVLPEGMGEDGELHRLHRHAHTGPRDQVRTPDWAPDSSRVAFAVFTQADSEVEVFEAILPVEEEPGGSWADLVARANGESDGAKDEGEDGEKEEERDDEKEDEDEADDESEKPDTEVHDLPARVVYKFLHQGGPNTPAMVDPHYAADSRHLVFVTEQSGFRHLGRLDPLYERFEPLTSGPFEVYLEFMPDARDFALVTSTREQPSCQDVYRVDLESGGMTRLTGETARYSSVGAAQDGGRFLALRDTYGELRELVAVDVAAGTEVVLTDSHAPEAKELTAATPEFFDFESRRGFTLHGMMFKPEGWKAEDRRPALIYVYGGPLGTRKEVVQGSYSGSAYLFAWYMAKEHGYVTATIDTRGMSGYGAVFEKANFEQVGKPQVEDLVDGARWLVENAGVDPERIGLHGWSFGGFQTQMCLYTEPEVFACGIAGAGPTEWENYNSWYSTGTIGESRKGTPDLEKYSLLPLAKNLERKLLLVHGMEDSNVLYQDTVRVYAELLKAGKETLVELFLDPSGGHGLGGEVKSLGRYRKYEEFLLRCLGRAEG